MAPTTRNASARTHRNRRTKGNNTNYKRNGFASDCPGCAGKKHAHTCGKSKRRSIAKVKKTAAQPQCGDDLGWLENVDLLPRSELTELPCWQCTERRVELKGPYQDLSGKIFPKGSIGNFIELDCGNSDAPPEVFCSLDSDIHDGTIALLPLEEVNLV
jgi:hypothetical protein